MFTVDEEVGLYGAKAVVTLGSADVEKATAVLDAFAKKFDESYGVVETAYSLQYGVSGGSNGHTTAETMNFVKVEVSVDFLVTLAAKIAQMK